MRPSEGPALDAVLASAAIPGVLGYFMLAQTRVFALKDNRAARELGVVDHERPGSDAAAPGQEPVVRAP